MSERLVDGVLGSTVLTDSALRSEDTLNKGFKAWNKPNHESREFRWESAGPVEFSRGMESDCSV